MSNPPAPDPEEERVVVELSREETLVGAEAIETVLMEHGEITDAEESLAAKLRAALRKDYP
jgi:hypothetical protein